MKRFCFAFIFLGILATLLANPITPIVTYRFWFAGNGDLNLELSEEINYLPCDSLDFSLGNTHQRIPFNPALHQFPYPLTFPDTGLSPESGAFTVTVIGSYFRWAESVSWGNDITNDISALNGTECAVQLRREYNGDHYSVWAKDYSPEAGSYNNTLARSTINVSCHNLQGRPIANALVAFYGPDAYQYTDANGFTELIDIATKNWTTVYAPGTWISVYDSTFFAEPDQTYTLDVVWDYWVANDDAIALPASGNFSIQPNVLGSAREQILTLRYDKPLAERAEVELYNLKGQLLSKTEYEGDEQHFTLPDRLGSGIYFLKLNCRGKTLGTGKLTILH